MKIVEVRGYWLEYALSRPLYNSIGSIESRNALIVELVTDGGHSGWGETQRLPGLAWSIIESAHAKRLLGSDPFSNPLANPLNAPLDEKPQGEQPRGEVAMMAASAIDIALWDLRGRILGLPIASLLGGARRQDILAYASGPFMAGGGDPYRNMLADVERYLGEGFTGFKLRCGVTPAADAEIAKSVRRLIGPDAGLMIDINTGYSRDSAVELLGRVEGADLSWIEEPLQPFDFDGYAGLSKGSAVPIAAGENIAELRDFRQLIASGGVSLIQPDLYLCGGISGAMRIAALADAFGTPYLPHVFGGTVNFYASLQLASVLTPYGLGRGADYPWFEYDRGENALRTMPSEPALDERGRIAIPDGPGIGIEISREMFAPFTHQAWELRSEGTG